MPTIKKQAPLLSEGEYCAQARKVTMEWSKPKPGTKSESVPIFRIPLHLPGGQTITTFARVMESTGWVFEQICKSGELIVPDGEEFVITADDLENRKFYFGVKHVDYNGAKIANVHFHSPTYAIQVNPALEKVSFFNEAPREVLLRSASKPSEERPPETPGATAPKPPTQPQPPASDALETLSDEELQSVMEYRKKLHRQEREGK